MQDKKNGRVLWYSKKKQGGIIICPESGNERFFFHISAIISGAEFPKVNSPAKFRPSDRIPEDGRLRTALAVEIQESIPQADSSHAGVA